MAIKLEKSQGINLKKGLNELKFTVSWQTSDDLDIQCLVLKDGKATRDEDFVFYGNRVHPSGGAKLLKDCKDGSKQDGDDETIEVTLSNLEPDKNEVWFTASIYNALDNSKHFGNVGKVTCSLIDCTNNEVLATYEVDKDLFGEIAGKLCRVFKTDDGNYRYETIGMPVNGLESLLEEVGLEVA